MKKQKKKQTETQNEETPMLLIRVKEITLSLIRKALQNGDPIAFTDDTLVDWKKNQHAMIWTTERLEALYHRCPIIKEQVIMVNGKDENNESI